MAVPSHCPLLDAQAAELATAAANITVHAPQLTYVSSSRARALFRANLIVEDLAWNMARPVLWHDTLQHALERGARMAVEVPGGGALARLAQGVFADDAVLDAGSGLDAVLDAGSGLDAVRVRIRRQRRIDD
jgi:malonate decarboxylase epsilon subunit